jgi:hypothetical protein
MRSVYFHLLLDKVLPFFSVKKTPELISFNHLNSSILDRLFLTFPHYVDTGELALYLLIPVLSGKSGVLCFPPELWRGIRLPLRENSP